MDTKRKRANRDKTKTKTCAAPKQPDLHAHRASPAIPTVTALRDIYCKYLEDTWDTICLWRALMLAMSTNCKKRCASNSKEIHLSSTRKIATPNSSRMKSRTSTKQINDDTSFRFYRHFLGEALTSSRKTHTSP